MLHLNSSFFHLTMRTGHDYVLCAKSVTVLRRCVYYNTPVQLTEITSFYWHIKHVKCHVF